MNRTHFLHWLNQIYATTEAEIDCDGLQVLLPAYVDFEVAGDDPGSRLPQVKAHLAQCPDCAEEYAGLRAVAELEAQGRLPQVEESLAQFGRAALTVTQTALGTYNEELLGPASPLLQGVDETLELLAINPYPQQAREIPTLSGRFKIETPKWKLFYRVTDKEGVLILDLQLKQ